MYDREDEGREMTPSEIRASLDVDKLGHAVSFLSLFSGPYVGHNARVERAKDAALSFVEKMFTEVGDDDDADG